MDPELLMMLPELFKTGYGLYDLSQSSKYAKTPRPTYEIPQAATQALNSATSQAMQTQLPGQGLMEQQMQGTTAAGINAAQQSSSNPSDILSMIAKLSGQQQTGMQNMAISAAQNYNSNQQNLQGQLGNMAGYQEKAWDWNKAQPYQQAMQTAQNLQQAGEQNIMGGLQGATNTLMAQSYLNKLYPQGKNVSGVSAGDMGSGGAPANFGANLGWGQMNFNNMFPAMKKTLLNPYGSSNMQEQPQGMYNPYGLGGY